MNKTIFPDPGTNYSQSEFNNAKFGNPEATDQRKFYMLMVTYLNDNYNLIAVSLQIKLIYSTIMQ